LFVDVGWHVYCALVHVDAEIVEMLIFVERKLARVESFRHRITYLSTQHCSLTSRIQAARTAH